MEGTRVYLHKHRIVYYYFEHAYPLCIFTFKYRIMATISLNNTVKVSKWRRGALSLHFRPHGGERAKKAKKNS
jgi:hypothetical protein